jgi:hypothetical protein
MRSFRAAVSTLVLFAGPSASAQVIDLTIHDVGLAIGDKPVMTGLRLNFRDARLERVTGANITVWGPYKSATGDVRGLALGIPATGANRIEGIGVGIFGLSADNSISGLGIGGVGLGAGGDLRGVMLGGLGVGTGGSIDGITFGGVGVGAGGRIRGIQVGGIGVGSARDVWGISIGGIGVGSGGSLSGLAIGGIGIGGGVDFTGVGIGGIGVGVGGDATGVMVGGVGVGSGGRLKGLSIGGIGVGAPAIDGVALSPGAVGTLNAHAIVVSGLYFKIEDGGRFDGGALSAVSYIQGAQHGLTIGLFNYARELHGAQIGILNVSDNDGRRRVLPIFSLR